MRQSLPVGIDELLQEFQAPAPSLNGGSAAAVVAAIAASLVVMVGRHSPSWNEGAATAAAAERLRERLLVLADEDVEVVAVLIAASRESRTGEWSTDLIAALLRSSQVPLEIAEQAADVAVLARAASSEGTPPMRADAAAAATLAASATAVAITIVKGNLAAPQLHEFERDLARIREATQVAAQRATSSAASREPGIGKEQSTAENDPREAYRETRRAIEQMWEEQNEGNPHP